MHLGECFSDPNLEWIFKVKKEFPDVKQKIVTHETSTMTAMGKTLDDGFAVVNILATKTDGMFAMVNTLVQLVNKVVGHANTISNNDASVAVAVSNVNDYSKKLETIINITIRGNL